MSSQHTKRLYLFILAVVFFAISLILLAGAIEASGAVGDLHLPVVYNGLVIVDTPTSAPTETITPTSAPIWTPTPTHRILPSPTRRP